MFTRNERFFRDEELTTQATSIHQYTTLRIKRYECVCVCVQDEIHIESHSTVKYIEANDANGVRSQQEN